MKRIVLIGLILFCIAAVASADLGPVVVDSGDYHGLFGNQVYADLSDDFVVAMVEGGEWETYVGLMNSAGENEKREIGWKITTTDGDILEEGNSDEYGNAEIILPKTLEAGNKYNLVYSYGDEQKTLSMKVVTAEEAGLEKERGDLEITGFENGDVLTVTIQNNLQKIKFTYNQCGYGKVKTTIEALDSHKSTQRIRNCNPTREGKKETISFNMGYNFFNKGEKYRITIEQGDQTVSKEFFVDIEGKNLTDSSYGGSSSSSSSQQSKAEKEENVNNAVQSATNSLISKINYNRGTKKKNTTIKIGKVSVPKIFYYNVNETTGGILPTITDSYSNEELDDSLSSAVHTLSDEIEYLKKLAEYPDELYVFPEYTYTQKRDTYLLTVLPFFAKKDGNLFGDKLYLYCIQQSNGEFKSGGKKYTSRRMGYIVSDEYSVRSVLQNAFSDSNDITWRNFVNRYSASIPEEVMEKAIPATEIDNQILPIGRVIIRKDADVRVRISPEMDAEVIGTAKKGATYLLYGVDDNGWLNIKLDDGSFGYIGRWLCAKYIDSTEEQKDVVAETETPATKDVPAKTDTVPSSGESGKADNDSAEATGSAKGTLIKHKVGLREKPEKDGKRIRVLDKGTKVDVLGKISNGEGLWYYVQYNNEKGYLNSEMLEVTNADSVPEL